MKILVTGGAGYVGSHTVKNLLKEGFSVIVLDNLSSGFIESIELLRKSYAGLEFIKVNLNDKAELEKIFNRSKVDLVMHFAAKVSVSESVANPVYYHQENYSNSVNLVEAMTAAGINKFIFSSSCVVYGMPQYIPIDENHPTNPQSPYGQTKLDFENYLSRVKNLKYTIFRYFNVAGSDVDGLLGKADIGRDDLMSNLIEVVLGQKNELKIYGDHYDTSDGTAIRDFLHVDDIAAAHTLALHNLDKNPTEIYNLGSEKGFSVREVLETANKVTGKHINATVVDKRPGDLPVSVASAKKVKEMIGWKPNYSDLESIISTDWNWRKTHPFGYTETKKS